MLRFVCCSLVAAMAAGCSALRPTPSKPGIVVEELVKTTKSWDGKTLPDYPRGRPQITIRRITIPPGCRLETHSHPVINAGILTRGRLAVVAPGGKTLQLRAGDPIVELVNTPHYGMNPGKTPAEIIVVYAGDVGTPIAVTKPR